MGNPILEQMGRKNNIGGIMDMMRGKSPKEAVEAMCKANPAFQAFYTQNKDKPIEEVCRDYNINPVILRQLIGK